MHPALTNEAASREYRTRTFGHGDLAVTVRSGVVTLGVPDGEEVAWLPLLPEQAERLAAQLRLCAKRLYLGREVRKVAEYEKRRICRTAEKVLLVVEGPAC